MISVRHIKLEYLKHASVTVEHPDPLNSLLNFECWYIVYIWRQYIFFTKLTQHCTPLDKQQHLSIIKYIYWDKILQSNIICRKLYTEYVNHVFRIFNAMLISYYNLLIQNKENCKGNIISIDNKNDCNGSLNFRFSEII